MNSWVVCPAMIGVDSASQKGTETPHCVISVHLDLLQENVKKKTLTNNRPPKKGWEDDLSEHLSLVVFFGGNLQTGCFSTRRTQNPDLVSFLKLQMSTAFRIFGIMAYFSPTSKPFGWWAKVFWRVPSRTLSQESFFGGSLERGATWSFRSFLYDTDTTGETKILQSTTSETLHPGRLT